MLKLAPVKPKQLGASPLRFGFGLLKSTRRAVSADFDPASLLMKSDDDSL
jgi:hypothetical protein